MEQQQQQPQQPQQPQQSVFQCVNPYMHMNAQFVQNGAFFVKDGIEYQIYYDADGILSFHRIEFYDSNSIDGEEAKQLRQNVEETERRAEETERRAEEAERRAEEAEQQVQTLQQVVQQLTKFVEEGEEEKKTSEASSTETPSTEAPSSSWSKSLFSTSEKEEEKEEKEEKEEEKKKPKIVVREHVVLKTGNEYSGDFVRILRELLPQLVGWLRELNNSNYTEMYPFIELDGFYNFLAKILGVSSSLYNVVINDIEYEIGSYNRKEDKYRVLIPFLNAVLRPRGVVCLVSDRGTDFRYLKLKITNQEKFEQNLSSLGDYLDNSDANILALIEDNSRN